MKKKSLYFFIIIFLLHLINLSDERKNNKLLTINVQVSPKVIKQGQEGILKLKIIPDAEIKISSNPKFMIKLEENPNLSFAKLFFTASELDFKIIQENDSVFLDLDKEIIIPFKLNTDSLVGESKISGEVIFTAVGQDNWSIKTFQKFIVNFISKRNYNIKKK